MCDFMIFERLPFTLVGPPPLTLENEFPSSSKSMIFLISLDILLVLLFLDTYDYWRTYYYSFWAEFIYSWLSTHMELDFRVN